MSHNHLPANRDRCSTYCPALWQIFYKRNISYGFYRLIMIMFTVILFTGAKNYLGAGGWVDFPKQKQKIERKQNLGHFLS